MKIYKITLVAFDLAKFEYRVPDDCPACAIQRAKDIVTDEYSVLRDSDLTVLACVEDGTT